MKSPRTHFQVIGLQQRAALGIPVRLQLQDDLLDLYGQQEEFGKKPGGDILMNKKTYLLVKALEVADENVAGRINNLMIKEKDPEKKIKDIRDIFDGLDISRITADKAGLYFLQAVKKLEETSPDKERKSQLTGFIQRIMKRNS